MHAIQPRTAAQLVTRCSQFNGPVEYVTRIQAAVTQLTAIRMTLFAASLLAILYGFSGCSGGINPQDYAVKNTIAGRITFIQGAGAEHFPPKDSLIDLRVVAFHDVPKDSNLIVELLSGTAIYTPSTLIDSSFHYQASIDYSIVIPDNQFANGAAHYAYIVVAQQYGPDFTHDWRPVGLFSADSIFTPAAITVQRGESQLNVNIPVDFLHLPPEPYK